MAIADVTGYLDPSNPLSGLVGTQINGKDIWSAYQTAQHIANYRNIWADSGDGNAAPDLEVTYHFTLGTTTADGVLQDFGLGQQEMTRQVFEFISEITNMTFREVLIETVDDHANLHLQNQNHSNGGGGAYIPHQGDGGISIGGLGSTTEHYQNGSYTQHLLYHEAAGHALGLRHPGSYNGYGISYQGEADHWNDSRQYTQMSYWGAGNTGGSTGSLSTMGLHDILALQLEYGVNETTNIGNDTYGYNASEASGVYDFTTGTASMGFSIWDAAGIDTLDFSGSDTGTQIDLRDGAFSSANGETHNVSIAYGAVVENAVGSIHDDQILGNTANNLIHGGQGHDVIRGGLDAVPDFTVDPRHFIGIEINKNPIVRDQYLQVDNIQSLSGQAFTVELMVEIIRVPHDGIQFVSYAVPGSSNEFLLSTQGGNGVLEVTINGATYNTTINEERLVDGQPHRISVSWDSTDGALNIYIDGQLADNTIHQAGSPLSDGGTLIFGQDQDSVGGGFQDRQVFQGTIGDIRIFDDVRTAAEINDNKFTTLTGNEANLVNNWQLQAGDTTTVTDVAVVNPSVNLTDLLTSSFTATQSSTYNAVSGAGLVLDDDTNTWNHTLNTGDEWLLLTFDQPRDITTVSLQNRPGQGQRLNGATVSVLDDQGNVIYTSPAISGASNSEVFSFTFPAVLSASAVRIDQDTNFLHIAELNVFGPAPAGVTVDPALLNTNLTVHNGGTVHNTAPVVDQSPDNDTLYGGQGNDVLRGGWGDDTLYGHGGDVAQDSPFAATTGIALNTDGNTDQYLVATNYQGIGGASRTVEFTVEMLVSGLSAGYTPLLSYANSHTTNAIIFEITSGGTIALDYLSLNHDTGISAAALTDGAEHRFSIRWDGAEGGEYIIYIDGVEAGRGSHPRQHWNMVGDGTLIFGQEQDAIGGGFQSNQIISGNIADIRIFNDIRTAQEITDNAFAPIANPATEQGLVNNWQVDGNSIANGALADTVGGTSLTITAPTTPVTTTAIGNWDNDTLLGGLGNDQLIGGAGDDVLDGGEGIDQADFNYGSAAATLNFDNAGNGTVLGSEGTDTLNAVEYLQFNDRLLDTNGVNQLTGLDFDNVLTGTSASETLTGLGGDDTLIGGAGADILDGGDGIDTASYANDTAGVIVDLTAGSNQAIGAQIGTDQLTSIENVVGGSGVDHLTGNAFDNILEGGAGADVLNGGAGIDVASYVSAGQAVEASLQGNRVNVGDALGDSFENIENLTGSSFNDSLWGDSGINALVGNDGIDTLTGGMNGDEIWGGTGDDILYGDVSNYMMGISKYTAEGLAQFGNDTLYGGAGNDRIEAGLGNDRLDGGIGNDILSGGSGSDTFVFANNFGNDIIEDFAGKFGDQIDLSDHTSINNFAALAITYNAGNALITIGNDTITLEGVTGGLDLNDFIF